MATILNDDGSAKAWGDQAAAEVQPFGITLQTVALTGFRVDATDEEIIAKARVSLSGLSAYAGADVVRLSPSVPEIEVVSAKYAAWHTHDDDEVRFVISGGGIFHLIAKQETVHLEVEPGDFILIPAGLEHGFELTSQRTITAVRFFRDHTSWAASFTGR